MIPYSKLIKALEDRKTRKKEGLFVLEGPKLLAEALSAKLKLKAVLVSKAVKEAELIDAAKKLCPVYMLDTKEFLALSSTVTPQGVLSIAEMPKYTLADINPEPFFLVLDSIQDPGNLGTLFRSALASGAGGLILLKNTVDPFNPKVVRSAMGALFKLPFVCEVLIEELQEFSFELWAAVLDEAKPYYEIKPKQGVGLIIGNEGNGISLDVAKLAKQRVHIPIDPRSESLNAATAASVVLFYLRKELLGKNDPKK